VIFEGIDMSYDEVVEKVIKEKGVEQSTLMKSPCLRYNGDFITMMFTKEKALIIKVSALRVNELIADGVGLEFNFTKKKFKQWVLIPMQYENMYESLIYEALAYAKNK